VPNPLNKSDSILNGEQMSETTQEETKAPVGLNIQDLILMVKLIHTGTERGAWRTDELSTVGGVFERLVAFLESAGAVTRTPVTDTASTRSEPGVATETITTTPKGKEKANAKTRSKA
jgi:hypothetical protein